MDRSEKQNLVASLQKMFSGANLVVVAHQAGLTVKEVTDLRRQMRAAGATFKVTKNRLARLALKDTPYQELGPLFTGPTAVACSKDPVAAAKIAVKYADANDKFTILGGSLGDRKLDVAAVKSLAKLPSIDALRAKLLGLLNAPATKVAGVLQAPAGQMARVIGAYAKKGEAA
ncbi:MAG: 50S ribosomal protein L10 [Alphaproteobacteria bacterium]